LGSRHAGVGGDEAPNSETEEHPEQPCAPRRQYVTGHHQDEQTRERRGRTDADRGQPPIARLQALRRISAPVEVVTSATVPHTPASPKPVRNTLLGLIAGLFLGVVAAFVRDSLDSRLKTPAEVEEHLGLARVGQLTESAFGRTVSGTNGRRRFDPIDFEAARIMRTNLDTLDPDSKLRSLVVTSPLPAEGKSTVAIALGWASAIAGKRTLLVGCDLRKPVLSERLGLRATPGLSDALLGKANPKDVLQAIDLGPTNGANGGAAVPGGNRLVCITAGTQVAGPAEVLASDRFSDFLDQVTSVYDLVVLDTSPMLSVVDTRELLPLVDGVVICARSYQTTRDHARATRKALEHASTRLAGLVVTGVRLREDYYTAYYRSYIGSAR
jgi:receptor protein-tyrosine kinase